ncbi:MAG: hypothetical protein H6696_17530 [Deferribacteres bacterium]|nr:hypothetical protein [Deferribacteres bacterium]
MEVTKAQGSSVGLAEVEVWQAANSVNQPRLEIEQVNVTDIDSNSAVIHWRTSIECTGECYVNDDTLTTTLSNSHTVFVENLLPGTTYPFLILWRPLKERRRSRRCSPLPQWKQACLRHHSCGYNQHTTGIV